MRVRVRVKPTCSSLDAAAASCVAAAAALESARASLAESAEAAAPIDPWVTLPWSRPAWFGFGFGFGFGF